MYVQYRLRYCDLSNHCMWISLILCFIKLSFLLQYSGGRSEQDFIDFLNEKCKTNRVSGEGISPEVNAISLTAIILQ